MRLKRLRTAAARSQCAPRTTAMASSATPTACHRRARCKVVEMNAPDRILHAHRRQARDPRCRCVAVGEQSERDRERQRTRRAAPPLPLWAAAPPVVAAAPAGRRRCREGDEELGQYRQLGDGIGAEHDVGPSATKSPVTRTVKNRQGEKAGGVHETARPSSTERQTHDFASRLRRSTRTPGRTAGQVVAASWSLPCAAAPV